MKIRDESTAARIALVMALVTSTGFAADSAYGAACSAKSGPSTVALVELYTSEGCDSCPPADRWFSTTFPASAAQTSAVPLAFHVDYWDRLGWKDRFATPSYTERQHEAMRANRASFVYTPQVLVQGKDFSWKSHDPAIGSVNANPARAEITLDAEAQRGSLAVRATARVPATPDRKDATLYVALADDGLASDVKAGENKGVYLKHDHVVRALRAGPKADANGEIRWEVNLPLPSEAGTTSTIVAFVQNGAAGDVLQTLALPLNAACAPVR